MHQGTMDMKSKRIAGILVLVLLIILGYGLFHEITWQTKFKAPASNWHSDKQVEDYFVEKLKISEENAATTANLGIEFRVNKDATLDAVLGNMTYYGLARDKRALLYALEHTDDTVLGKENVLHVGSGTIDTNASYYLTKHMTAWELADILLNKPNYWDFDQYNYLFMPHKPE